MSSRFTCPCRGWHAHHRAFSADRPCRRKRGRGRLPVPRAAGRDRAADQRALFHQPGPRRDLGALPTGRAPGGRWHGGRSGLA